MFLYISSLVFCSAVSGLLFGFLRRALFANWRQTGKRPIGYLLPVFLSLLLVWFTATQTLPRLLDLVSLAGRANFTEEIELSEQDIHWLTIRYNGQTYLYNRWQLSPEPGIRFRMRYTAYSRSVLALEEIVDD